MKILRFVLPLVLITLLVSSNIALGEGTSKIIWYVAPRKSVSYHYFVNGSIGIERKYYGDSPSILANNTLSLTVEVSEIETTGDGKLTNVFLNITVVGYNDVMYYYRHSSHGAHISTYGYVKPRMLIINVTQGNVPQSAQINFLTSANRGKNVYGPSYNPHNDTSNQWIKKGIGYAAEVIISRVTPFGEVISALNALKDLAGSTGIKEKHGVHGPYSTATLTLYQRGVSRYSDPEHTGTEDDGFWYKIGYAVYTFRTQVLWTVPTSEKSYSLRVSAQSLMGRWFEYFHVDLNEIDNYAPLETWYSANSVVTLTIKNGKITALTAHTRDIEGTTTEFYTKDYTPSWVANEYDYYAAPTLIVKATTMNNVPVNYKIEWGDGKYSYAYSQPTGSEYSFSHRYYPGGVGATRYYTIKITAYTDDYYGGWSETKTIEITVHNNGKMDDNGGGGGCPFLYTYNGEWREENNVLVWAENATRPFLNTVDNYLFEANEINGSVILGIGEPGEDVDFVDAVKLYMVYAPPGYEVAESYGGMIYAYRDVEGGIAKDNHGRDVTSLISGEDDNYWVGDKGDYVDITLNLSSENLLVLRGIDNPAVETKGLGYYRPPTTQSTIWLYANVSGEWVKLGEIKVRHSMHTNVINLDALSWFFGDKVELRFEMRDRNGIDFIGVAHDYRLVTVEPVALEDASYGYENISRRDGNYLRINPGDFVRLNFEGKGDGLYLVKLYGFYFNREMIGRGIGIASADEVNIAEAELQYEVMENKSYVLLPLLENYSGICSIEWYVDGIYVPYSKPVVSFEAGEHEIELYIYRYDGSVQYYSLSIS